MQVTNRRARRMRTAALALAALVLVSTLVAALAGRSASAAGVTASSSSGTGVWLLAKENEFVIREGPQYDLKRVARMDLRAAGAGRYLFTAQLFALSPHASLDVACSFHGPGVAWGGSGATTTSGTQGWQMLHVTGAGGYGPDGGQVELWCNRSSTASEVLLRGIHISAIKADSGDVQTQP